MYAVTHNDAHFCTSDIACVYPNVQIHPVVVIHYNRQHTTTILGYDMHMSSSELNNSKSTRIQSVQGLRAIAIIGVLLFHVKMAGIAGGFVGVDVFFVISGFVITLLLRRQMESDSFSFAKFYKRRAWRLMPALAFTLLISALVFGFLVPASEYPKLYYSLISAAAGASNFYFNNTFNYFDSGITNPALHTWSLGVEEQFYLTFPLLLLFLYRKIGKNKSNIIRNIILSLTVTLFLISSYETQYHQSNAFYLPWLRAWEFLSGASLALVNRKTLPHLVTKISSWFGILILVPVMIFYNEDYIFPGLGAFLPVIATMLLLLGSQSNNSVNKVLSSQPFQFIGNISYSLYLVHWPIVCFVGLFIRLTNPVTQLLIISASIMIGFFSWYFIEEQFRHGLRVLAPLKESLTPITLILCSACLVTISALVTNSFWNHHLKAKQYFSEVKGYQYLFRTGKCFMVSHNIANYDQAACLSVSNIKDNVLVMGDSLAANLVLPMQKRWPHKNIMQATGVNFIPGNSSKWSQIDKSLNKIVQLKEKNIKTFILYALWQRDDLEPLKTFVNKLKTHGHKVIVLGPSPQLYVGAPIILAYENIFNYNFGEHLFKNYRYQMNAIFQANLTEADRYFSPYDILCHHGQCSLLINGKPLFIDKVHLTLAGADFLVSHLKLATKSEIARR